MRLAGLVAILLFVTSAWAQEPLVAARACTQNLACMEQRVRDLRDYREFLEDQLALAKALIREKDAEILVLKKPPAKPEKP